MKPISLGNKMSLALAYIIEGDKSLYIGHIDDRLSHQLQMQIDSELHSQLYYNLDMQLYRKLKKDLYEINKTN